jgi:hypothetical protein
MSFTLQVKSSGLWSEGQRRDVESFEHASDLKLNEKEMNIWMDE